MSLVFRHASSAYPRPTEYIVDKFNKLISWYEETSGLKDVRIAQDKVTEASDRLSALQQERRQASVAVNEIHAKLKQIHIELGDTKRGEDHYVQLIIQENKLLKQEELLQDKLKEAEHAEREQFFVLTNAVKNSHEKERFQSKKTQYWSIIGSVIGAFLGIIGTSINNHIKLSTLKKLVHESTNGELNDKLNTYLKTAENIEKKISLLSSNDKNIHLTNLRVRVEEEENRRLKYLVITVSLFCVLVSLTKYFS